jgi:hypothetical protein
MQRIYGPSEVGAEENYLKTMAIHVLRHEPVQPEE